MLAWETTDTPFPAVQTFTNRQMAVAVAKDYRDSMHFARVIIRRDICDSAIGWNSVGKFIEF